MTFNTIQPKIQKLVEDDSSKVKDIITFASLTIRQPFYTMKKQMVSVKLLGSKSPYLFGFKLKTYEWLQDNADMVMGLPDMIKRLTDEEALAILTTIPGIGLAKGGFIMQLISGKGGCIDSHNMLLYKDTIVSTLKEYNINNIYIKNKYTLKDNPFKGKPLAYIAVVNSLGSAYLWDNWCEFIAKKYPTKFTNSDAVSSFHLECLM